MHTQDVPVLVVGAGPVGLSTALFLSQWGVRPLVVDKRDTLQAPPRSSTSLRTLEVFRSFGLGHALDQVGWRSAAPTHTVFKDSAVGKILSQNSMPPSYERRFQTCSPVDTRLTMTNQELQRIALTEVKRHGGEVRFGVELVDFDSKDDGVRARLADKVTGEQWEVSASYLIGADGATSTVRSRLGITMSDREVAQRLNTAFFHADLGDVLPQWENDWCLVRNAQVYATLFSKNGRDQWSSHFMDYPGKPDALTELSAPETVRLLHAVIGDDTVPIDLHAVNAWEAATSIASAYRSGRVFLAGDAAHEQSSASGLGMNTGVQDGHNLAWKIAAVLGGQASPALLDSYEVERRSAALTMLAVTRRFHQAYAQAQQADDRQEENAIDYLRAMMFYRYDSDAILDDNESNAAYRADPDDILDDRAFPGRRLPHRWVSNQMSTLDLSGARWTLLAGPHGQSWLSAAAAVGESLDLHAHRLDLEDDLLDPDEALLIRPDGFVAWIANILPKDPETALRQAINRILQPS